ncbi:MAG: hypothetical protein HY744_32210 [Deltaproteobacteria bacterium]|nr:hypothetical protein [Deltaproteobacteria bacterium]
MRIGRSRGGLLLALLGLVVGPALVAAASCVVPGFEKIDAPPGAFDAGADAPPDADAGAGGGGGEPGCEHVRWPDPPDASDPSDASIEFVVALRRVDLGEKDLDAGPDVGFDLDERCTCRGQGSSCKEPGWATENPCDGPGGRDNATALMHGYAQSFYPVLSSEIYSQSLNDGYASVLARVRDYNGQPNDEQVELGLYLSGGFARDRCDPNVVPQWDGQDRWPIDVHGLAPKDGGACDGAAGGEGGGGAGGGPPSWCDGGPSPYECAYDVGRPLFGDPAAYVTSGVLVANLPTAELIMGTEDRQFSIRLTAGFMTAHLKKESGGWALRNGVLAGRWRLQDAFITASNVVGEDGGLCVGDFAYETLRNLMCRYADILTGVGGPTTPCDAVSFGMAFESEPAQLGPLYWYPPKSSECPPGLDPAEDSCEPEPDSG